MSNIKAGFNGDRLKAARIYNGLTIADVAEKAGVSKQAISQLENNKNEPKIETLMRLMNVLRFPRNYFYQEVYEEVRVGDTYFRSLMSMSNRERMSQIEYINLLASICQCVEKYITFPKLNLYRIEDDFDFNIENLASEVRKYWDLKESPISNLIDVMERNGIIINSILTNSSRMDAYSQLRRVNGEVMAIVILGNDKENAFRRNFSAAHELGHLMMDDLYDLSDMSKLEYRDMENIMNRFAGALLIPQKIYHKDLQTSSKTDLNYYIQLKRKYHVSAAALIVRANQIGEITTNQYQYLMKQLSQRGYRRTEPFDKETPPIKPRYLKEAMRMIIEEDQVSGREILDNLGERGMALTQEIVEEILGLKKGYLSLNDSSGDIVALERKERLRDQD